MASVSTLLLVLVLGLGLIVIGLSAGASEAVLHEAGKGKSRVSRWLAVGAGLLLVLAQLTLSVATGCLLSPGRCGFKAGYIVVFVLSWISIGGSIAFLTLGARDDDFGNDDGYPDTLRFCFILASALASVTLLLNLGYLFLYTKSLKMVVNPRVERPPKDVGMPSINTV